MARDELILIRPDQWDHEVWGSAHESPLGISRPKLFFYFGENDHWVANRTRDDLIATRGGSEEWKPHTEIDRHGTGHGFCTGKCRRWNPQ